MDVYIPNVNNNLPRRNGFVYAMVGAGGSGKSDLKDRNLIKRLNKMIVKTRHINCSWIFTLQAYNLFPKILRKQITNATIFKPIIIKNGSLSIKNY
jgi:ABC-type phosphate transport system ATPase subunit